MPKKNILCIVGSLNQTSQLSQIASFLSQDYNIYYTQVYGNGFFYKFMAESGIFDNTVLGVGSSFIKASKEFLKSNNLNYDYRGETLGISYDLVIMSTDLIVPSKFKNTKKVWVQEGMIDLITPLSYWIRKLNLPLYLSGNTSLNGTSNKADIFFAASKGYKKYFSELGTDENKILCTGVPNFDDIANINSNGFEYKDYVLIATSDIRELGGNENRVDFIQKCVKIANGKRMIFKPHPNEDIEIVSKEIIENTPKDTLIIPKGDISPMIKNCDILITQFSSTVYLGLVLGKKIYSYFEIDDLKSKCPIQNNGQSAKIIASIVDDYIHFEGSGINFIKQNEKAAFLL
jgi:hypothetical protein